MTPKDELREIVDDLSEQEAEAALLFIECRRARGKDGLAVMLDEAPRDDEPTTHEEEAAVQEARREYERGDILESDQIKRELG